MHQYGILYTMNQGVETKAYIPWMSKMQTISQVSQNKNKKRMGTGKWRECKQFQMIKTLL